MQDLGADPLRQRLVAHPRVDEALEHAVEAGGKLVPEASQCPRYSFQGGSVDAQTIVVNNPDNSGQLTLYSGTTLTFKAVWLPNGSGQWWTYDPNGAQSGIGNWT